MEVAFKDKIRSTKKEARDVADDANGLVNPIELLLRIIMAVYEPDDEHIKFFVDYHSLIFINP